ncbi:MAG: hypothetical protein HY866_04585, partial [Chloroflexi bacterium]|nr:hypothetical protein [Chloroflexota bacterium]
ALWDSKTEVRHLVMTAHGIQTALGLDEEEAFRSLLLGMVDAYQAQHYPPTLERVTFVDRKPNRVRLFQQALDQYFIFQAPAANAPAPLLPGAAIPVEAEYDEVSTPEFHKPEATAATPHVFVAMPFKDTYDDQFYLAIQPSVKEIGLLCERMDLDAFTGEITERMFERIESARLVIALLDGSNPNVYLEVGYAWGVRAKTVLIAHKEEPLPFDVRGHRVLIYDKIYQLKEMLGVELKRLLA